MKRAWYIIKRIVAGLILLVCLLVGGLLLFARTAYARAWLREEVVTTLRNDLGLEASFDEVEFEFLPPRAHVLDVVVNGSDDEPFVTASRVTVALRPIALLRGKLEVTELTVEEPNLHVVVEGREVVNLPPFRRATNTGGSQNASQMVSDVGVLAGTIDVEVRETPAGPVRILLEDVNVDVTRDDEGNHEIRLLITDGAVTHGDHDYDVEVIQGRVAVRDDQASLRHFRLSVGDVRASIPRATVGTTAPFDAEGRGEVWIPLELLRRFPIPAPLLTGATHASFQATREDGRLEAEGNVDIDGLVIGPAHFDDWEEVFGPNAIGDVSADFRYRPEEVVCSRVVVNRPAEGDGSVTVQDLTVDLADEAYPVTFDVVLDDIQLAEVLIDSGLYASRVRLQVSGITSVRGQFRDFRLRFYPLNLRYRNFEVLASNTFKEENQLILGFPQGSLRGVMVIDTEGVHMQNFAIGIGRTQLTVNAMLGISGRPKTWWLRAATPSGGDFRFEDIGGTIAGLQFAGNGTINAHITGTYGDPTVRGNVDLHDFEINGITFGHLRGPIHYRDLLISLPAIVARRNQSAYRFNEGRVDFRRGGVQVTGMAQFEPLLLADAVDMFDMEDWARTTRGAATGQAQIRYDSRRDRWRVEVASDVAGVTYENHDFGAGELEIRYDSGDITIDRLALTRATGGRLEVGGTISRTGRLGLDVEVDRLPIQTIENLPEALADLRGTVRGRARVFGTTNVPRANGWADISPVFYREHRFDPSRLRFRLQGRDLRLNGRVAGRMVEIDELRLGLRDRYPLWFRGTIRGLDLARILPENTLPDDTAVRLDARLDAGVELGRLGAAARRRANSQRQRHLYRDYGLAGDATIDSLTIENPAFGVRNLAPMDLYLDRDRVNIVQSQFALETSAMSEASHFDLAGWASFDALGLHLRGTDLDLGFVPELTDTVEQLEGTIDVDCQVGGTPGEPALLGSAGFRLRRFQLAGIDQVATQVSGSLTFSRNVVLVDDLSARMLGGRASGSGRVALSGLSLASYRLDATVHDANIPLGPRSSAVVNGNVNLTSPRHDEEIPLVGGTLEVVRLHYAEPMSLGVDLDQLGRPQRTQVSTYDPADDQVRVDLRILGGRNLRIENNLARSNIVVDDRSEPFRLVGTSQMLNLLGTLRTERRGAITFRDTQFEIERGVVEFTDPFEANPDLDFLATAVRRDWTITLAVRGTRNEPEIHLTSDPPLPEASIVLLMTVGFTLEESEQMGVDTAAMGAVPELLIGMTGLDDELNRLVPILDELRITTGYSERTGRVEPRVQIGRRLTRSGSVRIGASAGLTDATDIEANLEVRLRENLSFEVVYENDEDFDMGNIGGDLRWRTEF